LAMRVEDEDEDEDNEVIEEEQSLFSTAQPFRPDLEVPSKGQPGLRRTSKN
jgi:hypothetical protein